MIFPAELLQLSLYCRGVVTDQNMDVYTEHELEQAEKVIFVIDEFNLQDNERLMKFMLAYVAMADAADNEELPLFDFEIARKIATNKRNLTT